MITDSFCELQYDEQHQCHYCKNCICKKGDVYYEGREPTDAEIEDELLMERCKHGKNRILCI